MTSDYEGRIWGHRADVHIIGVLGWNLRETQQNMPLAVPLHGLEHKCLNWYEHEANARNVPHAPLRGVR